MDLSFLVVFLLFAGLVLILPLIGKKWSAIISYILFGAWFALGAVAGFDLLSRPSAGTSHQFGVVYVVIAGIAAAMIILTYRIYRYRQGKRASQASK
jgi:multidrug transporter EmrE-like cation transporter